MSEEEIRGAGKQRRQLTVRDNGEYVDDLLYDSDKWGAKPARNSVDFLGMVRWFVYFLFKPHTLFIPNAWQDKWNPVPPNPHRTQQATVRLLSIVSWGLMLFALAEVFLPEMVRAILSLVKLDGWVGLVGVPHKAAIMVGVLGMAAAAVSQFFVWVINTFHLELRSFVLLFDPGMSAAPNTEGASNTTGKLYAKAMVARLLNMVMWGIAAFAFGFMPVIRDAVLDIAWLDKLLPGLSFLGNGLIAPVALGLLGAGCALVGQGLAGATKKGPAGVSRLGSFMYGLLVEPFVYARKLGTPVASFIVLTLLHAAFWAGVVFLTVFSLPTSWFTASGATLTAPLVASIFTFVVAIARQGRAVYAENQKKGFATPLAADDKSDSVHAVPGAHFLKRHWESKNFSRDGEDRWAVSFFGTQASRPAYAQQNHQPLSFDDDFAGGGGGYGRDDGTEQSARWYASEESGGTGVGGGQRTTTRFETQQQLVTGGDSDEEFGAAGGLAPVPQQQFGGKVCF